MRESIVPRHTNAKSNTTSIRQIGHSRTKLWDLQTRIIRLARPAQLRQAIAEQGLFLEPVIGGDVTRQRLLAAIQSTEDELGNGEY